MARHFCNIAATVLREKPWHFRDYADKVHLTYKSDRKYNLGIYFVVAATIDDHPIHPEGTLETLTWDPQNECVTIDKLDGNGREQIEDSQPIYCKPSELPISTNQQIPTHEATGNETRDHIHPQTTPKRDYDGALRVRSRTYVSANDNQRGANERHRLDQTATPSRNEREPYALEPLTRTPAPRFTSQRQLRDKQYTPYRLSDKRTLQRTPIGTSLQRPVPVETAHPSQRQSRYAPYGALHDTEITYNAPSERPDIDGTVRTLRFLVKRLNELGRELEKAMTITPEGRAQLKDSIVRLLKDGQRLEGALILCQNALKILFTGRETDANNPFAPGPSNERRKERNKSANYDDLPRKMERPRYTPPRRDSARELENTLLNAGNVNKRVPQTKPFRLNPRLSTSVGATILANGARTRKK
ncbi:hypothetical protein [Vibrio sonorensis]|uniref:hypothetical protein n=1 Tax=Vibrio sonorensis TaxID=1004316 RepID=UPI0011143C65|nr:hypothetical protein [Vibrio sonorensis]